MNVLEDQVTDLNYLAESPIPISIASMNRERSDSSAESPRTVVTVAPHDGGNSKKRKAEETNGTSNATHTRAKRNRYISIAWYVVEVCIQVWLRRSLPPYEPSGSLKRVQDLRT